MLTVPLTVLFTLAADPVIVASARGHIGDGKVTIDVVGQGGAHIDPDAAYGKVSGGRLYVYVKGARVRSDNRAWNDGTIGVVAHRHVDRLELEVVLPSRAGCSGPVRIAGGGNGGLRAELTCAALSARPVAAPRASAAAVVAAPKAVVAPAPTPAPKLVAPALTPPLIRQATYRPVADEDPDVKPVDRSQPAPRPAVAAVPIGPVSPSPPVVAARPKAATAVIAPHAVSTIAPRSTTKNPTGPAPALAGPDERPGSTLMVLVIVVVTAAVALSGWRLVVGRRSRRKGRIRILEKRRIGIRRSLIVAQVDEQILLLGAGENGISVLRVMDSPAQSLDEPVSLNRMAVAAPASNTGTAAPAAPAVAPSDAGVEESAEATALRELFGDRTRARWQ